MASLSKSSVSPLRSPTRSVLSPKTSNIATPFKKSTIINPFTHSPVVVSQQQQQQPIKKRAKLAFSIFEDKVEKPLQALEPPTSNRLSLTDQENILQPIPEVIRSNRIPLGNLNIHDFPAELHVGGLSSPLRDLFQPITLKETAPIRYKYTNVPSFVTPSRRLCRYLVRSFVEEEEEYLQRKRPQHRRSLLVNGIRKSNFTILSA